MEENADLIEKIKKLGYEIRRTSYRDQESFDKGDYSYRYWILPEENYKLKNTPFFYNIENDFIHFTSMDSLFSILNSKHIRLYNLPNMDDKFELDYAKNILSFDKENNDKVKEQLYILSMCSASSVLNEIDKKKEHLLWKLYGKNGNGIMIKLKIENDLDLWMNYYLSECFYNLDNFQAIKELNEITESEILDLKIGSFIKLPIYEFENEIRLVFDKENSPQMTDSNNKILYPKIYHDKLNKSDNISYIQLPLTNFFNLNSDIYSNPTIKTYKNYEIPKIRIDEIFLGYRFNEIDLKNIQEKIAIYDSSITVKFSDLKEFF